MRKNILFIAAILLVNIFSFSQSSENVDLLYLWNDTTIELNFRDARYSDVWGFEQESREYAVIGSTFGTHVFDVTDPVNTVEVDRKSGAIQGFSVNHRDYKDYNGYLYGVCDEGASTLQIFDTSFLPDSISLVYDSNEFFTRAHTIFIDEESGWLYACGTNAGWLNIYSLENPELPVLIAQFDGAGYVHDMYAKDNIAYLNAGDGLYVVDFSNIEDPQILGTLTDYEDQGYNHSGWLHENGETYVFCDETPGSRVKIANVSDLSDIQIVSTVSTEVSPNSIAHNAFIKGDILYIAYYNDGMWMFNISDPVDPYYLGHFDTFPFPQDNDNRGAWGVYPYLPSGNVLVSDRNTGFHIFNVSAAENAVTVHEVIGVDNDINIYPNPFSNEITIEIENVINNSFQIEIRDVNGKVIVKELGAVEQGKLKLVIDKKLPLGIYVLQIVSEKTVFTKKLIKN